jgi:cation transport regulator ChaC
MQLYFAYGSNLLRSQMTERCPEHQFECLATLADYRFLIGERGYATIEPSVGDSVHGVVYHLSPSDEETLDRREGVSSGCYRKDYLTLSGPHDLISDVIVYVDPRVTPSRPKDGYMDKIPSGASQFDLPSQYQQFLASFDSSEP